MGINEINNLYNNFVSSNIFHLHAELCKSVHKCNFDEFFNKLDHRGRKVNFLVILRVYAYDIIISTSVGK